MGRTFSLSILHIPLGATLAFVVTAAGSGSLAAQDLEGAAPGEPRAWRFVPTLGVESQFDDNIFLLGRERKDELASGSAPAGLGERYADMENASDFITSLEGSAAVKGPGLLERSLTVTPELRYAIYARNPERSHARLGLTVEQALPKEGRVRLRAAHTPSYFSKNYLADANDWDGDGTIASDERVFASGTYQESELSLDWRLRLVKSRRDHPLGTKLRLGAGYYDRAYDPPFAGRDLSGPTADGGLLLGISPPVTLEVGYGFAALSATRTQEVLLLDESDFGVDFNGDGSADDLSVRTVQMVDRSRAEHRVDAGISVEVSEPVEMGLHYELRVRDFGSRELFDVANRDRRDTRNALGLEMSVRLAHGLRLGLAAETARQTTNRRGDPGATGDIEDYVRNRASVALAYRL